jgi:hypothetical protein
MSILVRENALSNSEPYPIQSPLLGLSWEISMRSSQSLRKLILVFLWILDDAFGLENGFRIVVDGFMQELGVEIHMERSDRERIWK